MERKDWPNNNCRRTGTLARQNNDGQEYPSYKTPPRKSAKNAANMNETIGWLIGLDNVETIEQIDPALAARWAVEGPFWVFFGIVLALLIALLFYVRRQHHGSLGVRVALSMSRALLLVVLFLTLADPVLHVSLTELKRPLLYLVFDGTDSMAIEDEYPDDLREALAEATGVRSEETDEGVSRIAYVRGLLTKETGNVLARLTEQKQFRLETFLFDGNTTSRLRRLESQTGSEALVDGDQIAGQLTTDGQVTALGDVLSDIHQQFGAGTLTAVIMFSDFAQNSGAAPVGGAQASSPAAKLDIPIYAVGVGATEATDLAIDLQTDPKMKKAERTSILVKLRQSGLQNRDVMVTLTCRGLRGELGTGDSTEIVVGRKVVSLVSSVETVDFTFTPEDAGRFEFVADAEPLDGEVTVENNRASREVNVIDDFLRLMYVAYEPSWEWRFVKEVFHRDKLIGIQGFRTYLASSDPQVRESNVLFLPTLTPKRSEFFASDVLFLDDMPRTAINDRFCDMVREFVGQFGGGLVVIAGPRFGPAELCGTPLADMLPVILDPDARIRDDRPFRLQLTPHAARYPFMQLGSSDVENVKAWNNLRLLPWYQGVAQLHDQGYALAEHPTDTCRDGSTPQPLIAIRQYGAGEVVYLGFNEMWRLRRLYGERYYRTFWSQLIYRLGMSHALGSEKRFVVRTDRQQYRAEDKVTLTVEAYDENYEPLTAEQLPEQALAAELIVPGAGRAADQVRDISVGLLRRGVFESQIPVYTAGRYSARVKDPVSGQASEVRFEVTEVSAERRRGVRNLLLQDQLAAETQGKSYDLLTVDQLVDDLQAEPIVEHYTRNYPLWSTPLWFILLIGLMLGEWFWRKMIHLT